jgi:hypothetical protein
LLQQETAVMKIFAWCAAITPYRRAPEDTLAHTKTPPLLAWEMSKPGEEELDQALYAPILHNPHALYTMV